MSAFTCKVFQIKDAPKKISLIGDKRRPESAQHVIEFPGGAIEVSRTSNGNYWAHIHVNREWACDDMDGIRGAIGEIKGSRIATPEGIGQLDCDNVSQIAVLIETSTT